MDYNTDLVWALVIVLITYAIWKLFEARAYKPEKPPLKQFGDMTLETLDMYSGFDPTRPILLSVNGTVYNVSEGREFYGRGGSYHAMAGKECARALAKMSLNEDDFSSEVSDCSDQELQRLNEWIVKIKEKYPAVGKIVPMKKMSLEELKEFDGKDKTKPMYLSIRGVVFDVTSAPDFYGPDGMYPFAGRECARAFALVSVEESDCTDNLEGLSKYDLDTLKEWEFKFRYKYPVVGNLMNS